MARQRTGAKQYQDVIPLLEAAFTMQSPRLVFRQVSDNAAIRTIYRMNAWRVIDRHNDPTGEMNSKYDDYIFRRDGADVIVERRQRLACVVAFDENGDEIPLARIMRPVMARPTNHFNPADYKTFEEMQAALDKMPQNDYMREQRALVEKAAREMQSPEPPKGPDPSKVMSDLEIADE